MNFKVGDKVICIDPLEGSNLEFNEVYTINKITIDGFIRVSPGTGGFHTGRFVLMPLTPLLKAIYDLE